MIAFGKCDEGRRLGGTAAVLDGDAASMAAALSQIAEPGRGERRRADERKPVLEIFNRLRPFER